MKSTGILLLLFSVVLAFTFVDARAATPRYAVTHLRSLYVAASAYQEVSAINDNGIAAGLDREIGSPRSDWKVSTWDATGGVTAIPALGADVTISNSPIQLAIDINNSGQIVSMWNNSSFKTLIGTWSSAEGWDRIEESVNLTPRSIADDGTIVGSYGTEAAVWRNGVRDQVPLLPGNIVAQQAVKLTPGGNLYVTTGVSQGDSYRIAFDGTVSNVDSELAVDYVLDVNRHDMSVAKGHGAQIQSNGSSQAVDFTFTFQNLTLAAINDSGVVIGSTQPPNSFTTPSRPFFIDSSQSLTAVDLNTLIDATSGWRLLTATDVNNRGQIVGVGSFDHDGDISTPTVRAAYRLDPIRSPGDTNYDDVVDFDDLLTLAQHYGQSGNGNVFYETGDFNFDWVVDFDDLLTLAQNYGFAERFESDWALARSLVPEPATLALLLCIPRRRRN